MSGATCNCFVAKHPEATAIDSALRAGMDPREVATRFGVGKSRVYDHRKHLGITVVVRPSEASGDPSGADAAEDARATHEPRPPSPASAAPKNAPAEPVAATPAPTPPEPVKPTPRPPVPPVESFHGTVEPRVESRGTGVAQSFPETPGPARALPVAAPKGPLPSGYLQAIDACLGLLMEGQWRTSHIRGIAEKFGLSVDRARHAYHEATRHVQLDMGGYLQKQATSAAWVTKQRNEARGRAESAHTYADRWRRQEREAQERADKLQGEERMAALSEAARFGMLATKYDLSAEKWSAQALAHQRHLDDVLCLRSPKELVQNNFNLGADGTALMERFGSALAARFQGRPDVLAEIEAAAADMERGADVIETTWEAA